MLMTIILKEHQPSSDLDILGGGGSPTVSLLPVETSEDWVPYHPPQPGNQRCSKPLSSAAGDVALATLVSGLGVCNNKIVINQPGFISNIQTDYIMNDKINL